MGLIKKLRVAKKAALPNEKPPVVKTHLRNMIIVPEMIGSVIGIYNGKVFNSVEIKPEMTGHYLAEFSISYKPVKHGRPGIGATHCTCIYVLSVCNFVSLTTFSYSVAIHSIEVGHSFGDSFCSLDAAHRPMIYEMQYVTKCMMISEFL
jgi:ribosomal protein S19